MAYTYLDVQYFWVLPYWYVKNKNKKKNICTAGRNKVGIMQINHLLIALYSFNEAALTSQYLIWGSRLGCLIGSYTTAMLQESIMWYN